MPARTPDYHKISDPRVLRAIAHPTRERVLAELYAVGPLRAADIAEAVGIPANQASFHLRQLAKYGLVAEAPELARDGRDRVWRLINEHGIALDIEDLEEVPGGRAAVRVWRRQATAATHDLVETAYAARKEKGRHVMISANALSLTAKEAKQFGAELAALVDTWSTRTTKADTKAERITYHLFQMLQPYPDLES